MAVSNLVGRLTAEWTQMGACPSPVQLPSGGTLTSKVIGYDPLGRTSGELQCTSTSCGAPYLFTYTYNRAGGVTSANNGLGTISWQPTFDSYGRPSAVGALTTWNGPEYSTNLFTATGYGALGITDWTAGDNVPGGSRAALTFHKAYDNRLRPTQLTTTGSSQ